MSLRGALAVVLLSAPAAAQDYIPDSEMLTALVEQVEVGDQAARQRLERAGRNLFIWAAQRRLKHDMAHLVARVGLAAGTQFGSMDSGSVSRDEKFWRNGIVHALHDALAADSGDIKAASMLESMAPYPHVWIEPQRELQHLRALAARHAELPPQLVVTWLDMELERGDPAAARTALQRVDIEAVGVSQWQHLAAQVAYASDDSLAEHHYWAGAAVISSAEDAAIYRADIAWIAGQDELAEWDSLSSGSGAHAAWLRQFWAGRDLADSRLPGTRLREHFSRWWMALRDYRWDREGLRVAGRSPALEMGLEYNWKDTPFPKLQYASKISYAGRYRPVSLVLDDRGNAVMRHGIPDREAQLPGITGFGQALLAWQRPEGPLVMSFSTPAISTINEQPSGLWGMIARNMPVGDLLVACQVDAELCGLAALVESGGNTTQQAEQVRLHYQEMRQVAESTEENPERFASKLESYIQAYGIPGGGVLVSYAIRARDLEDGMAALRVVVGDREAREFVAALSSNRRWALPDNPDAFLIGWTEVASPPGTWQVGVVLSDRERGRGHGTTFTAIPAVDAGAGGALRLGDPILGRRESGLRWSRQRRSIPLNPTGAWRTNEEGVLDVEAYGLVPGREYRLSIEVREAAGAERSRLAIGETIIPDGSSMVLQRNIAFDNLEPATYRLAIRITDAITRESSVRERVVPILK